MAQVLMIVSDWIKSEQGWTYVFIGDFFAVSLLDLHDAANKRIDRSSVRE